MDESERLIFDVKDPAAINKVRHALFLRLRAEGQSFNQLGDSMDAFYRYIEVPDRVPDQERFAALVQDVCWELFLHGVLAPGTRGGRLDFPLFHVTDYGQKVLEAGEYLPYDPSSYIDSLRRRIPTPDPTVIAYLHEALDNFRRRSHVSAVVMTGIAAERVFDLFCESLLQALADPSEQRDFEKRMKQRRMKRRLDWTANKLRTLLASAPHNRHLPDDAELSVSSVYNLMRNQRNDNGHPKATPPSATAEDAFGSLHIFPRYYAAVEGIRDYFDKNKV